MPYANQSFPDRLLEEDVRNLLDGCPDEEVKKLLMAVFLAEYDYQRSHDQKKSSVVTRKLEELLRQGRRVIVLVHGRKEREALETWFVTKYGPGSSLRESFDVCLSGSRFTEFPFPDADCLLFTGVPQWNEMRWVFSSLANKQLFLVYPWEWELLRKRMESMEQGKSRLGLPPVHPLLRGIPEEPPGIGGDRDIETLLADTERIESLLQEELPCEGADGTPGTRSGDYGAQVKAVRVVFENGSTCDFAGDDDVQVVLKGGVDWKTASKLKKGDSVLFLDGDARRDLLHVLKDLLLEEDEFQRTYKLAMVWNPLLVQKGKKDGWIPPSLFAGEQVTANMSAAAQHLHQKLRELGCSIIHEQTIRHWLRGNVLAPQSRKDQTLLFDFIADPRLDSVRDRMIAAIKEIRNLSIKMGKKLAALTRDEGWGDDGDELLQRFGVTQADVERLVKCCVVSGTSEVTTYFGQLGVLHHGR